MFEIQIMLEESLELFQAGMVYMMLRTHLFGSNDQLMLEYDGNSSST